MSTTRWTKDQLDAIYTKKTPDADNCNILVNAAAGSGKTAVLVERMIQKLLPNEQDPSVIDVDRLLVVTFTNAAAAELRQRIMDGLLREVEKAQDPRMLEHLKRQLTLVHGADITTIDSFCIKVIRNYFHLLQIDPNFLICTEVEAELMQDEAMDTLFDELYEEANPEFIELANLYTNGRDDEDLRTLIKELYNFTRSCPDPALWMAEKRDLYLLEDGIENSVWMQHCVRQKEQLLDSCVEIYERILKTMIEQSLGFIPEFLENFLNEHPPVAGEVLFEDWKSYYLAVCSDYQQTKVLLRADWDTAYTLLGKFVFQKINASGLKYRELTEGIKEDLNAARKNIKESLKAILNAPTEELQTQLRERVYPVARELVVLVNRFEESFYALKEQKNVLDFSDVEHLTLKLFKSNPEVAEEFRNKYDEILMDEYQDSNALQEEIFASISRGNNLFMVGDIKQSIYRFRKGDPTIFKAKNDTFEKTPDAKNRKIVLSKNFRSRKEVLAGVNAIFERIMSEQAGEMEYDADQRLYLGDETYEQKNPNYLPECYVIERYPKGADETLEKVDRFRLEARFIAQKIRELKDTGFRVRDTEVRMVHDEAGGFREEKQTVYRPIRNKDIAILMQSHKKVADIYKEELVSYGAECFVEIGGYFAQEEIEVMLSLVKVLCNPYQDIPLIATLRSAIGNFDDSMLAKIRSKSTGAFYKALKAAARDTDALGVACAAFLEKLKKWRRYSKYMSSDKLIWTLLEETQYYTFCGTRPNGESAQANLRMLFERARLFEDSGYKGLFNFIRYINRMKKKESDLNAASMLSENHDVVRIMTIHKSKGLEFPVVFLAGCGKEFFAKEHTGDVILHKDLGLGMDYINFEERYKIPTISKRAVASAIQNEAISEEIRKLYVALTRAKEKLYVTATIDGRSMEDAQKYSTSGATAQETKWDAMMSGDIMDPQTVLDAKKFINWIAPVARQSNAWEYGVVPYEDVLDYRPVVKEQAPECVQQDMTALLKALEFVYPYENVEQLPTKISVTELKRMQQGSRTETELRRKPAFLQEETPLTGAQVGTVVHLMAQTLPYKQDMQVEDIKAHLKNMVEEHLLTDVEAAAVDVERMLLYCRSDLVDRMRKSDKVYREIPFETAFSCAELGIGDSHEPIILQGVIDCYFEEDDGITLVDFKTDYYEDPLDVLAKYRVQLDLYAAAIEKITQKVVKHKILYLFFRNDVVEL